jgi:hypothetical protein
MKKSLRSISIAFLVVLTFGFGILTLTDLYTENSVKEFAKNTANSLSYNWNPYSDEYFDPTVYDIQLGTLLIFNMDVQYAHREDGFNYQNVWRTGLANNPQLAYLALSKYNKAFFGAFEEQLQQNQKTALSRFSGKPQEAEIRKFVMKDYWVKQRKVVENYDRAVQQMLALPDATLNKYLKMVGAEQGETYEPAAEVHQWAVKTKIVDPTLNESGLVDYENYYYWWNFYMRPVDLMLLTYRISSAYPQWTPRKFLLEVQKFSSEVKKVMPGGTTTGNTTPTLSR